MMRLGDAPQTRLRNTAWASRTPRGVRDPYGRRERQRRPDASQSCPDASRRVPEVPGRVPEVLRRVQTRPRGAQTRPDASQRRPDASPYRYATAFAMGSEERLTGNASGLRVCRNPSTRLWGVAKVDPSGGCMRQDPLRVYRAFGRAPVIDTTEAHH